MPTPETEPCQPDSYYGITKHAAERYVHATAERPDLGLRFPRDLAAHVQRLRAGPGAGQSVSGRAGHLLGQPAARRADHHLRRRRADARLRLHRRHRRRLGPRAEQAASRGGIFNLGSGRSLSINQLAEHAIAAFGHPPGGYKIVRAPGRPGEQRTVQADIGRAKSVLGWEPQTTFETGLAETVRWAATEFAAEPPLQRWRERTR